MYPYKIRKTMKERNKPDADLANVAYELSSKGRNTILTTKLPGMQQANHYLTENNNNNKENIMRMFTFPKHQFQEKWKPHCNQTL